MRPLIVILSLLAPLAATAELTIFDVRKNLAMSNDEKVFRDFYINGGSEAGLTTGMILTVQRRLPLYDSYQNRSAGDLELKVAKIKVIHVQKGLAVARLYSEFTRENAPILEDNFIMVGDRLDLGSAERESKKAEAETAPAPAPEPVAALRAEPKILVNSVELSSHSSSLTAPDAVQAPVLQ